MSFEHRTLASFLAIARLGSIGKAADALGLSQPALSRKIAGLEKKLGVPLFARHAGGMELTVYGRSLLPRAETIALEAERAGEEIDQLRGAGRGLARIGVVPSATTTVLSFAVNRLVSHSPACLIHIREGTGEQLLQALGRGEVDLVVSGRLDEPLDAGLVAAPFYDDDVGVIAAAAHPLFSEGRPPADVADLLAFPWAMPPRGNVVTSGFREMFLRHGVEPPRPSAETSSIHVLITLVASTSFLTVLPHDVVRQEVEAGRLNYLAGPGVVWRRSLVIVRRRSGSLPPVTAIFLDELRKAAAMRPPP
ncbi:MAG: LysR family transcriptional regulator [Hyphomicrobiales bacterium]|nr:MAG: LysR family transcriptional regulator [Hyphomicrobiales bacterium]